MFRFSSMLRLLAYQAHKGHSYRNLVSSPCTKASQLLWARLQFDSNIRRNVHLTNALREKVSIKVPQFDDSITQGDIFFEKTVGDTVHVDERIGCIETDKISVAVQSPVDGRIVELLVKDGDTVKSDKPIVVIESSCGDRRQTEIRMTRMRMRIADRLKESQNTMASLTTFNEIDMSATVKLRKDYGQLFMTKHGVKLGYMSPFIRATVEALRECSTLNAYVDENQRIVYRNYIDLGFAVSTEKGLVVPVIRNANALSMVEVEKAVAFYSRKANLGDIKMEDMDGGTFTISNGGVFGGLFGTPIINEQQAGILGIYGIKDRPIAINGKVEIRPMAYVALTYDHRLVDGKEAVTFLGRVKELMEDPLRAPLEV